MIYRLGVEDIEPNHWIAFVFDHPGCFSPATTQEEAIAKAPTHIAEFFEWLASFVATKPPRNLSIEVQVAEVFHSHPSIKDPDYIVNALFEDDRKLLTRADLEAGLIVLNYAHKDLSALIEKIPAASLNQPIPGDQKNSVAKILDHVAWAEWWYFDRLGMAFPRGEMRGQVMTKLEKVRAQTCSQLPNLLGDARVIDKVGEEWSARKVLRRTLWHERDHTQQIAKLVAEIWQVH